VINRNINFTDIFQQHFNFCAFRRNVGQPSAFLLRTEQIFKKAAYAVPKQATEICIQGG
jgi:FO synthase subunit 2